MGGVFLGLSTGAAPWEIVIQTGKEQGRNNCNETLLSPKRECGWNRISSSSAHTTLEMDNSTPVLHQGKDFLG